MSSLKEILHDYHTNHRDADILYSTSIDDYMAHSGVVGMKWGVKHGPPYPLGRDISTGKALKVGAGSAHGNDIENAGGVATALTATMALYLTPMIISFAAHGIALGVKYAVRQKEYKDMVKNSVKDPETGLYKKTREYTKEEDIRLVNKRNYDNNEEGTSTNCVLCSMTYELRRQGYNCTAKTLTGANGVGPDFMNACFKNMKLKKASSLEYPTKKNLENPEYYKKFSEAARKVEDGDDNNVYKESIATLSKEKNSRGMFVMNFGFYGGHAINYEVDAKGKVEFIDTQNGKVMTEKDIMELCDHSTTAMYARLDNKKPNGSFLKENVIYEPQESASSRVNEHTSQYYEQTVEKNKDKKVDKAAASNLNDILKKARKG